MHGFLNFINHDFATQGRNPIDLWTGSTLSATLQNTFFTMASALLFWAVFVTKKKGIKLLGIALFIFSILNAISTDTRTGVLLPITVFVLMLIIFCIENRKDKTLLTKILSVLAVCCCVLIVFYIFNIFNFRKAIQDLSFFDRGGASLLEDPRFIRWYLTIKNMWQYPFGGKELREMCNGYAHNLWLDMIQNAGLFVGFLFLIYTFISLRNMFRMFQNKEIPVSWRYLLVSVYIGLLINYSIEAVLDGSILLVLMLFF